ncbi:MAG: MazG nucleotide pyrophosphohydrolase domain-containing protein [Candidatus Pacearchaeota archaeon]|jgi:NTP pyrophosphatase (non-canonical NTP hydrolase)
MTLDDIQKDVDNWTGQFTPQYWPVFEQFARLAEETGEVGRELNHLYGTKKKKSDEDKKDLGQELVDVIFTIACIANSQKIDLQEAWNKMMNEKHYGRDNQRYRPKNNI